MALRAELLAVIEALLALHPGATEISLDALGEAIGTRAISHAEIDAMLSALEERGVDVVAPSDPRGERDLAAVLSAARSLSGELGRRPNLAEIAERSGLDPAQVRHALMLARIMQR